MMRFSLVTSKRLFGGFRKWRWSCPPTRCISSWLNDLFQRETVSYDSVRHGMKSMYKSHLEPLESAYQFHAFHSPKLRDADFDYKPSVMLIGQYSTGKTTFLQHIVGKDYPGIRIGPEPTTDKFIVIMNGDEATVPGNALAVDPSMPYAPLSKFGNKFLNRFQASKTDSPVLQNLVLIDTPGILSGEAQSIDRGYDFKEVIQWFAERVDRVVLLFDAHKLDISDEFKKTIQVLSVYEDKLRIVLNKADRVNPQQLMRVYGALMWSLGKIINTPEVIRVYIGSFWKQPLQYEENRNLFELEHQDLFKDLQSLPKQNSLRKLNDFIRRARLAKVHAYIISELKKEMPMFFGKEARKDELIRNLNTIYRRIQLQHSISAGDFPDLHMMQRKLQAHDFSSFSSLDAALIAKVDDMLVNRIPPLISMLPQEDNTLNSLNVTGGIFDLVNDRKFNQKGTSGVYEGIYDKDWIVAKDMPEYEASFRKLAPTGSLLSITEARKELMKSSLPSTELALIWRLSDVDEDNALDLEQWALANHLVKIRLKGFELPDTLPEHLYPPGLRQQKFE